MERIGRRVRAGGEREPIRRGDDQHAAGAQRTRALAQEALVIPDVLDHLQRGHRVERRRAHRQGREVGAKERCLRVGRRGMLDRHLVVVEPDHPPRDRRNQRRAVTLAAPDLEHQLAAQVGEQGFIGRLMPLELVVLRRDPGEGAFAGERQRARIVDLQGWGLRGESGTALAVTITLWVKTVDPSLP